MARKRVLLLLVAALAIAGASVRGGAGVDRRPVASSRR